MWGVYAINVIEIKVAWCSIYIPSIIVFQTKSEIREEKSEEESSSSLSILTPYVYVLCECEFLSFSVMWIGTKPIKKPRFYQCVGGKHE